MRLKVAKRVEEEEVVQIGPIADTKDTSLRLGMCDDEPGGVVSRKDSANGARIRDCGDFFPDATVNVGKVVELGAVLIRPRRSTRDERVVELGGSNSKRGPK